MICKNKVFQRLNIKDYCITDRLNFSVINMKLFITAKKTSTCWVFDHDHRNTIDEALCNGTENVIDFYFQSIERKTPEIGDQINFLLDTERSKYALTTIDLIETSDVGSYYKDRLSDQQVWLCPWLQGYFGEVPERIYIDCFSIAEGISEEELDEIMKDFSYEELNEMVGDMQAENVLDVIPKIDNNKDTDPID